MNALFPANDTQSAYPPADVLLSYVTVIEAAEARRDAVYALRRDPTPAEDEACSLAESQIDAARLAIRDALGMTRGELQRLVSAAL
jgi:hypothetical protein